MSKIEIFEYRGHFLSGDLVISLLTKKDSKNKGGLPLCQFAIIHGVKRFLFAFMHKLTSHRYLCYPTINKQ